MQTPFRCRPSLDADSQWMQTPSGCRPSWMQTPWQTDTEWRTLVKTLSCPKLRLRAVIIIDSNVKKVRWLQSPTYNEQFLLHLFTRCKSDQCMLYQLIYYVPNVRGCQYRRPRPSLFQLFWSILRDFLRNILFWRFRTRFVSQHNNLDS